MGFSWLWLLLFFKSPEKIRWLCPALKRLEECQKLKVKKSTDLVMSLKVLPARADPTKAFFWPWNLPPRELSVCGHTVYCHLSWTTGGKKQQMFSDWPIPLGTPQSMTQDNGSETDNEQSQPHERKDTLICSLHNCHLFNTEGHLRKSQWAIN